MKRIFGVLFLALFFLIACNNPVMEIDEAVAKELDSSLALIVDSPSTSSSPHDYVKTNQEAFDLIVKQGDATLQHFSHEFSQSDSNGLKEYIMALACIEILGKENPVNRDWETGKEWYEKYKES
ncbi:hypothetical protein [Sutcliffiella halmapala]|uniref:hypothetical protein n=1 Tax=Sutcliffiella halmapala TaxID=79882 RepID=UPI000995223A|nr:hypothetical protein [Sutcliffiella halmapala]